MARVMLEFGSISATRYHTRYLDGGDLVLVYGDSGARGSWYELERSGRVERFETVSALLRSIRGRDTRWGFSRYFRLGRWGSDSCRDTDLTVLDLFAAPPGVHLRADECVRVASGEVGSDRVVSLGDEAITVALPPAPSFVRGVDLSCKAVDVANLLFKRFGRMIRTSRYDEDDVLQEVYKGILVRNRGKGAFDPERGKFGSYVSMVCLSVVSNYHRKESRHRHREKVGVREYVDGEWREVDVASSRTLVDETLVYDGDVVARDDLSHHLSAHIACAEDQMVAVSLMNMLADGYKAREITRTLGIGKSEYKRVKELLQEACLCWRH